MRRIVTQPLLLSTIDQIDQVIFGTSKTVQSSLGGAYTIRGFELLVQKPPASKPLTICKLTKAHSVQLLEVKPSFWPVLRFMQAIEQMMVNPEAITKPCIVSTALGQFKILDIVILVIILVSEVFLLSKLLLDEVSRVLHSLIDLVHIALRGIILLTSTPIISYPLLSSQSSWSLIIPLSMAPPTIIH